MLKLFSTHKPQERLQLECQLMLRYKRKGFRFLKKRFQRRIYYIYGCEISPGATVDPTVKFVHPIAIVIGSQAIIHADCKIYQNVTIGSNLNGDNAMPEIHNNTFIGTGAKIIGGITIGQNCIVGANAVVTKSVPENSTVVGYNHILSTS